MSMMPFCTKCCASDLFSLRAKPVTSKPRATASLTMSRPLRPLDATTAIFLVSVMPLSF